MKLVVMEVSQNCSLDECFILVTLVTASSFFLAAAKEAGRRAVCQQAV